MSRPYTLSTLIDDLRAIYHEHGDCPVFHGKDHDLHAHHVRTTTYDDWENSEKTPDGEIPAVGIAVAIGPRL
jgi:hypothetical protein